VLFLCMYLGYMTIVISVERVLYLYHYLIPLVFSILLATLNFTYIFKEKSENERTQKYVYTYLAFILLIVFAGYIFYAPFTYYWPLTEEDFQGRNLLKFWGMKSVR
jgi:dolichyl-phosphate-mannose-protein mannosyltransferase